MRWQQVFIALGSNLPLGDKSNSLTPPQIIHRAYNLIGTHPQIFSIQLSAILKNPALLPADFDPQKESSPDFYNAVARVITTLAPCQLLGVLQGIELALGRVKSKRWRARSVDLDIILFDNQQVNTPNLIIPHPEMQNRDFVLCPLLELVGRDFCFDIGSTTWQLPAIIAALPQPNR